MRHIIPVSGKDSLATAIVQIEHQPDLPYELMFNPTGAETPEVDDWLAKVEVHLGLPIARVGANLENIIDEQGILPGIKTRYCTRLAKIYPMEDWIGKDNATVYYGIRADEQRTGYVNTKKQNITPAYPLIDMNMGINEVWALLEQRHMLPPLFFWQSMFDMVERNLGSEWKHLINLLDKPTFHRLFAGRSRANCYFCFFQRTYEWIWLLETHPQLFWNSVEIEENTGAKDFNWRADKSLRTLAADASGIKERRAQKIATTLRKTAQTRIMFDDEPETPDLLQIVSCGLFCGK